MADHKLHDLFTHNEPVLKEAGPRRNRRKLILIILAALLLLALAAGAWLIYKNRAQNGGPDTKNDNSLSEAVRIGQKFSNGACEGSGKKLITASPMKAEDVQMVLPYGTMVGGHVMPTSHQYLEPWDRKLGRDKYEVRAAMDATLYSISRRAQSVESGEQKAEEFQLWFAISCTHFYYYDLMTSLSPDLLDIFEREKRQGDYATLKVQVKAGQVVGRIGGQTLDYGVWDTELPAAAGILVPEHYEWDGFRLYLADPLNYYTDELKAAMLSKYIRTAEPTSGKVDYDIDGKLIGGWFVEGTGERHGGNTPKYWTTHLAIAPEYIDPSVYLISVGDFAGEEKQFSISRSAPDPKNVGVETGLVKYDLLSLNYLKSDGTQWDRMKFTKGVTIINDTYQSQGCVLVQMLETRKLKFEGFKNKKCSAVSGFTANAKIYTR